MAFPSTYDSSRDAALEESEPTLSLVDAVMAETIGMAMHNAVAAQNQMRMMGAAAVTAACVRMIKATGGVLLPPLPPVGSPPVGSPPAGSPPVGSPPPFFPAPPFSGGGTTDEEVPPRRAGRLEEAPPPARRPRAAGASLVEDAQAAAEDAIAIAQRLERLAG